MLNHDITSDPSLERQLLDRLISRGWHISCAESCTGGMLVSRLIGVPDASRVLNASFVTYSEEAKVRYAHVRPQTIARYGVVSEEVAAEMAAGAALETDSEIGVGITGLAGPAGGSDELPVGTVCFGFFVDGAVTTKTVRFGSIDRNEIRTQSVDTALASLLEQVPALPFL